MSLTPLPPGHVGAVVTRMEMDAPPPAATLLQAPLRLERWENVDLNRYRSLFRRVGAPWLWSSRLAMTDAVLRRELGEVHAVVDAGGADVGLVELDRRPGGLTRIRFLGLVLELAGQGSGPWLIQSALTLAWQNGTTKVDLYTCTLDHLAAMPTYLRAGFVATERSFESFRDPRLVGLLPRDCAPHVPLLES